METLSVKDSRMYAIISLYDIHTKLYRNVIEGISDNDAHNRLNTKANHVAWLAGSLVNERLEMVNLFSGDSEKKLITKASYKLFEGYKGIQDNEIYPTLSDYRQDWETVTPVLKDLLENISTEKLNSLFEMPEMTIPYYELITYMAHREAYCIGQIGLWRRLLNYAPMKYQ
ncbi:DinB family protein [Solitalea lacus]|uniref:DinB family protein n=1 Tax=Solitalea lacus TaxID=2911172 RepID=UPI001EDA817A|nr:DinB family protein [Solitalea lacus]UKJ05861.1 DinB family protein [Solitalea lacus]